jgi:hypothetical protein
VVAAASVNPENPVTALGEKVQDAALTREVEGADSDEGAPFGEPWCDAFNHAHIALVEQFTD